MPTIFNPKRRNAIFINTGGTVSPTPTPPSFNNTKSLLFDGVDEYILAPQPFLNSAYVFSFSFWAKKPTASDQINVGDRISAYQGMWINWYSDGNVYYQARKGANESMVYALSFDTDWHHFVVTFDNGVAKLYIDGSLVDTFTFSASFLPATTGDDFRIGAVDDIYFGTGNIDEVGTWDVALGSTAITELYNSGTPIALDTDTGNYTSASDLQAWYRNGDNSTYKLPQILMPENTNKDKVSNYSMTFDGVDDYINCGNILDFTGSFSLSAWVKTSSSTGGVVIAKDDNAGGVGNNRKFLLQVLNSTGKGRILVWHTNESTFANVQTTSAINDGNWHHISVVNDISGDLKIYVDGVDDSASVVSGVTPLNPTTVNLYIGAREYPTSELFLDGTIDEVSAYDSALSSTQVSDIYNSGTPTTITGATAYWKLGEQATFTDNWLVPNSALSNYSKFSFAFDGVDDRIQLSSDLTASTEFTFSFWMKPTTVGSGNGKIYPIGTFPNNDNYIKLDQIGVLWLRIGATTIIFNEAVYGSGVNNLVLDEWQNITFIRDSSNIIRCYRNGTDFGYNVSSPSTNTNTLTLNSFGRIISNTFGFEGNLDDISWWTSDETANISTIGSGAPTDLTSLSPLAWWRLGDDASFNTNWSIPDQIASNNGTSANMTIRDLQGEAPNYSGGGISNAMTIEDRVGDAPNSDNNAVSYNMESTDIDNNTP